MILFIAAKADSEKVATELLTHESLSLETRASTDPEKIRRFVEAQNNDPELQSWTMFQIEVPESSISQIIGS